MATDYPFYEISSGKRAGLHQFLFLTEAEYRQINDPQKAKAVEYDRIRAKRISTTPELKAKWSERRTYRRRTVPGLRAREAELERNRRRRRLTSR
jgi:hypothetical protein